MKRTTLVKVLLAAASVSAAAQVTSPTTAGYLSRAESMLAAGNYSGCLDQLRALQGLDDADEQVAWLRIRAMSVADPTAAVGQIRSYLARYEASEHRTEAIMLLADCMMRNGDPAAAAAVYATINTSSLSVADAATLNYRHAYALMEDRKYAPAAELFEKSRTSGALRKNSEFYLGYIAYCQGDYARARQLLEKADLNRSPGFMASYYLAQINYAEGNYAAVLGSVKDLLSYVDVAPEYIAEANRLAGESLFQQGNADKALPYLRTYVSTAKTPERSALYLLGTEEFKLGNNDQAVKHLTPVATDTVHTDAMTQSSLLYLGQALMAQNKVNDALPVFSAAMQMDYDRDAREAANYNYAVAKFGGARAPFGSSVATFEEFLAQYPNGRYAPVVQEYLVSGYLTDQNYEAALASIQRMHDPGDKVLAAKQQVLYALGTRALATSSTEQALNWLRQADALSRYDEKIAAQVALSLGEALYRDGQYAEAVKQIKRYMDEAPASDPNRAMALYDLGYAQFAQKSYKDAAATFDKFISMPQNLGPEATVDAMNRLADSQFYAGNLAGALASYKKAYDKNPASGDYPVFQQAVIEGYRRDNQTKIATINRLLTEFPTSSLIPDALLEMTEGYIQLGNNAAAIDTYKRLVKEYGGTEQGRRGYLQMALTQLNAGQRQEALKSYREVVRLYPTSEEARMALDELKRIAADEGTLAQLGAWLQSIANAPHLEVAETDVLTFEGAEKAWLADGKTARLQRYLIDYPNGSRRAQALGYLMEEASNNGRTGDALTFAAEIVANYPDSRLAERALIVKAGAEHALGRGNDALASWTLLESRASTPEVLNTARTGIMRVARDLGDQPRVIAAADALLASSTLGSEARSEARFSRALALDLSGSTDQARKVWEELADNTDDLYGAKSAYYLAQSLYDGNRIDEARQRVENFIDAATPHTYWLARGFILLSDIYAAKGKKLEAREYLESLRENYPGKESEIFQMIDSRLAKLKKR